MGVENNECIIATTWDEESMDKVRKWVKKLSKQSQSLFAFVPSVINSKITLFMGPDGSKKGWDLANNYEEIRNNLIEFLKKFDYEDGSSPFDYIEVGYGEYGQKVLRGNCENMYNDEEYTGAK